jgi:hypothetical protein
MRTPADLFRSVTDRSSPAAGRSGGTAAEDAAPAAPTDPTGASTAPATSAESTAPAESTVSTGPAVPGTGSPRADCTADGSGGLTFDVAGLPAASGSRDASLVLRRRGGETATDEVRLPLGPAGVPSQASPGMRGRQRGGGRLRAVLPGTPELPEGRWDAYAALGGTEPERVVPGVLDLRALVDRRPDPDRSPVAVRVPYATKHGNLTVRSWVRAPHAEAGGIRLADGMMILQGRLYGVAAGPGALLEARRRDRPLVRTAPVSRGGEGVGESTVGHGGEFSGPYDFTCTLALGEPAGAWEGGTESWDLWLRPGDGAQPVRIARILDDVSDKKHIFSYPSQPLSTPRGPLLAGPYYTVDNDLAVRVEPADGGAA